MTDIKAQLGKFEGSWVHDRDDNYDAFLRATGESEEKAKYIVSMKPRMVITTKDDELRTVTQPMPDVKPDLKVDMNFKMDKPFEWKYKDDTLDMHLRITATIKGNAVEYLNEPLNNQGRKHTGLMEIINGEFVETSTYEGVSGKRIYKRE